MRLLFVKENLAWPRSSGHDVHCYHMMRALAQAGHALSLVTLHHPCPEAVAGLPLGRFVCLKEAGGAAAPGNGLSLSRLQERFRSYWGIDPAHVRCVGETAREWGADVVVVVGLNVLPYLGAVEGALRVWYAADEWAWHHLSMVRLARPGTWENVKQAVVKGLYERAYAPLLDRVWVVSEADRFAMRWLAGVRGIDVLPNGVDGEHFTPLERPQTEQSCAFWGRLDFGPNVQALEWFCRRVWPQVREAAPAATFTIYGFQPTAAVRSLSGRGGIRLVPDLPDLREEVARQQVVVLPFVSGGGIKNKLLEAAAMAKAVLCTPRACGGLRDDGPLPLVVARGRRRWAQALLGLWSNREERRRLGREARAWAVRAHSWAAAAGTAVAALQRDLGARAGA